MSDNQQSIMLRLKTSTADLHTYAEKRPLQKALAKGELPRDLFAAYLGQLLFVHEALEWGLRDQRGTDARFAALFQEDQSREPNLRDDLAFYGLDADLLEPLPATRQAVIDIEKMAAESPLGLIGMLYVLEGSNNGSKFISRVLMRAYQLQPGPGLSYLDPYGERQMERWQEFKRTMDAAAFTADEADCIVEAAKMMFQTIADISDAVSQPIAV